MSKKNNSLKTEAQYAIQNVGGSAIFTSADLKKKTPLTWFEKFALLFIKKKYQIDKVEGHTLVYKIFRGKFYVINHWINPPQHWNCRCQIVSK